MSKVRVVAKKILPPNRHIICKSAAILVGTLFGVCVVLTFDNRKCVDIVNGAISPTSQHIGLPIKVTWHMKPYNYCDGEVTDFFKHSSGYHQSGETRATSYALLWDGNKDSDLDFVAFKTVPDGLEGEVTYEPIIRRWHNPLQHYLNPITYPGIAVKFTRLGKLSEEAKSKARGLPRTPN